MPAFSAGPTGPAINDSIASLKTCEIKSNAGVKQECANKAFKVIWDSIKFPNECAKSSSNDYGFNVINIEKCVEWLVSLEIPEAKAAKTISSTDSVNLNERNIVEKQVSEGINDNQKNINDKNNELPIQENRIFNIIDAELLLWVLIGVSILFLIIITIGYILLKRQINSKLKLISDLQSINDTQKTGIAELKLHLKNAENKIAVDLSKSQVPMNNHVIDTSVESAAHAEPQRSSANLGDKKIADIQSVMPASEIRDSQLQVTAETLLAKILIALANLANARSNLTEANFIFKLASVITDSLIKSSIIEKIESVQFFRSSGNPSAQSPELIAFALKDSSNYCIVPYPYVGRVSQFSQWFNNTSNNYQINPVLATKPALGLIGSDGNLMIVSQGILA